MMKGADWRVKITMIRAERKHSLYDYRVIVMLGIEFSVVVYSCIAALSLSTN